MFISSPAGILTEPNWTREAAKCSFTCCTLFSQICKCKCKNLKKIVCENMPTALFVSGFVLCGSLLNPLQWRCLMKMSGQHPGFLTFVGNINLIVIWMSLCKITYEYCFLIIIIGVDLYALFIFHPRGNWHCYLLLSTFQWEYYKLTFLDIIFSLPIIDCFKLKENLHNIWPEFLW